ncbi:ABC transporter substrate-binding protein [Polaribacter cellanae]|uniref:ABC transporter substrate-binding protein n=1 Tax=Polaribacter cellanae TaxID=2818493 RepID=A0A975CQG4_9FLAO|nr:helical backbone metal receptor [Polaribacter cellanae]QTE23763.1 ABC transporter substrate-binding protein [Polaribacter cellanae]
MNFKDQINNVFELKKTPKRIISLVPSQTELLVDLGLENCIVGVTKFCVHPKNIRKTTTVVGGTKTIHIDKIKALKPDIILCNKEENTKEIVEICQKIAPTHVSDIYTINDSIEVIKQYGAIFSKQKEAQNLVLKLHAILEDFNQFIKNKPTLKVIYFIWKNPWMIAGNTTFINYLLALNNFKNVYENLPRYPEITIENLKESDLILLSSEPYPFKDKHIVEIKKYAKNAKIILVDGEYFSWYGSRLLKAFDYFKELRKRM